MSHRNMSSSSSNQDRKRDEEIADFINAVLETYSGGYKSTTEFEEQDQEFEDQSGSESSSKSSRKK